MTVENISWSISTKECCRPRRGLNPRPPDLQSDGASNWATEAGNGGLLRGDLFSVLPSVILFLWFSVVFRSAITSLGGERANLSAFRSFVRFALVWFCLFSLLLGVWEGLRYVIVALPGLFSYRFFCDCGTSWTFLLQFLLWLWHSLDFSLTFFGKFYVLQTCI